MNQAPHVAIVGATGAVGVEILSCLETRNFPVGSLKLLASARSAGKQVAFRGKMLTVEELTEKSFDGVDIALFSAGGGISLKFAPIAAAAGCVVIDNSSAFRQEPDVPLVVPEINPEAAFNHPRNIIANPNCTTIITLMALFPLHQRFGLKTVIASSYQAVSGSGQHGIAELETQVRAVVDGHPVVKNVYPHQIAFNLLPQIDSFTENGYTKEELKMLNEGRKILSLPELKVTCTCVRVPVFYGHSESVNIETERKLSAKEARAILAQAPGVQVYDNPSEKMYPLAVDAAGEDATYVGRIREDDTIPNGLNMWIVADNIRKGAALNAVQIAEELVRRDLLGVKDRTVFIKK